MTQQTGTLDKRFPRWLYAAAMVLFLVILLPIAVLSLGVLAKHGLDGPYEERIVFLREPVLRNLLLTAVAVGALAAAHALLNRFARIHLSAALMAAWMLATLVWVLAIGVVQERDCESVLNAALAFAQDDYAFLRWGYFTGCPFQLGFVLVMEGLTRLFPWANLNLLVQCLNAVCGVVTMGALAGFAQEALGDARTARATVLLYAAFLPSLLFCIYVYGTLLMLALCACALLCFARYLRTRQLRFAVAMAVLGALGYVAKLNALIVLVALTICALIDALETHDVCALLCAALSIALGLGLMKLVVWQYAWRGQLTFVPNVHRLTWLVMGLSENENQPGWYNGYVGEFFDRYLDPETQLAIVKADLVTRIQALASDPAHALVFFRDKGMSQWLEPTHTVMSYGERCFWSGRYNGLAALLYRPNHLPHTLANAYMNIYQQALYGLACVGGLRLLRGQRKAAALVLPVTVIGGFLFHELFEAKSQYIYVYAIYLIPLAAHGLCTVEDALRRGWRRMRSR